MNRSENRQSIISRKLIRHYKEVSANNCCGFKAVHLVFQDFFPQKLQQLYCRPPEFTLMPQGKYLAGGLQSGCTANSTGVQYILGFQSGRLGEYKDVERTLRGNQTRRKKIWPGHQLRHFRGGSGNLYKSWFHSIWG